MEINCEMLCAKTNRKKLVQFLFDNSIDYFILTKTNNKSLLVYIEKININKLNILHNIPTFIYCKKINNYNNYIIS